MFDRGLRKFLFAASGAVGLRNDFGYIVARIEQSRKRRDREGRCPKEHDAPPLQSHSPAFISFLILRLITSRFKGLK